MLGALKKIKYTQDRSFIEKILEEEIHLFMMQKRNKLIGEEKDLLNFLISVNQL